MKRANNIRILALLLALLLTVCFTFTACQDAPGSGSDEPQEAQTETQVDSAEPSTEDSTAPETSDDTSSDSDTQAPADTPNAEASTQTPASQPSGNNDTSESTPQQPTTTPGDNETTQTPEPQEQYCSLSIDCITILSNMDQLTRGKEGLVPSDGILLGKTQVKYEEGDTVYTLLKRELQSRKMHFEFQGSGSSAYLAGLCNLYEQDCGKLSGWEFTVNGTFPSVGLGVYKLSPGDTVALRYTCDLGNDIGDSYNGQ